MNDVLINTIRILEGIEPNLDNFSFTYLFATENISGFSKKISFKDKTILTVCSSGDQAFNAILNDALTVDLFDVNIFSKYYFNLKLAAIKSLNYEEFLDFLTPKNIVNKNNVFLLDTYLKIRNEIRNEEIKYFWDYLFCHYSGEVIYNSKMFCKLKNNRKDCIECNDYLKNENNFNKLKKKLKDKEFKFYNINIFNDKIQTNTKYDFIYLSNIFDSLKAKTTLEFIKKLKKIVFKIKENLTNNGMIGVSYLYLYFDDFIFNDYVNILKFNTIENKNLSEFEYIDFPSYFSPKSKQKRNNDAMMIYKNIKK